MEHYTWNKPKCLLPLDGKPLLYHLLERAPESQFIVIGDYLFDVLKSYIEAFPPPARVTLVRSGGKGTCSGIAEALALVDDPSSPLALVWCDLLLDELPQFEPSNRPLVGLSSSFPCRWSFDSKRGLGGRRRGFDDRGLLQRPLLAGGMGIRMMRLSTLKKTWIFDLDGVLAPHNGYRAGIERLLPGVAEFFEKIAPGDTTVLLSSRDISMREASLAFLAAAGIRIDHAIFGLPHGERVLFNDRKTSGLATAHAVNLERDKGLESFEFVDDPSL